MNLLIWYTRSETKFQNENKSIKIKILLFIMLALVSDLTVIKHHHPRSNYPTHDSGISGSPGSIRQSRHKDAYEKYPGTILSSHPDTYQLFYVNWNDLRHWVVLHWDVWLVSVLEGCKNKSRTIKILMNSINQTKGKRE